MISSGPNDWYLDIVSHVNDQNQDILSYVTQGPSYMRVVSSKKIGDITKIFSRTTLFNGIGGLQFEGCLVSFGEYYIVFNAIFDGNNKNVAQIHDS